MGEDEEREHFSLSSILKEEKKDIGGKKKRRKRRKKEEEEVSNHHTMIEITSIGVFWVYMQVPTVCSVFLISFPLSFQPAHADNFKMDVHDPRFSALFDSHIYAPDPVDPQYK